MKFIHYFKTTSDFTEVYNGRKYIKPWLSYTEENRRICCNKLYIKFKDPEVERICIENFSRDGIGVTYEDAAIVTNVQFGTIFSLNIAITSFDELRYFMGLTQIPGGAFEDCSSLTSIVIPDNVTNIYYSFRNTHLQTLTLGKKVNWISGDVGNSKSVKSLFVEDETQWAICYSGHTASYSGTLIGEGAHMYLKNGKEITNVRLPEKFTQIGVSTFQNFSNIKSIYIPSGVTSIYSNAFNNSGIESITLSSNIMLIEGGAFGNCKNLVSANLKDVNITITGTYPNWFDGCSSLVSVVLPDTLETIRGWYMFRDCTSLTTFAFPPNLETLSISGMFRGCSSLRSITSWGKLKTITSNLSLPQSVTYLAPFPDTLEKIGDGLSTPNYERKNIPWVAFMSTIPPELSQNGLDNNGIQTIYIPYSQDHSILASYQSAENWTKYANLMVELNPDGTIPT